MNTSHAITPQPGSKSSSTGIAARPLNSVEAAGILKMNHRTLVRWARNGYVPAHPLGEGGRRLWRFFEHEILAWVESQKNVAAIHVRSAA